jgi:hypothetical protein
MSAHTPPPKQRRLRPEALAESRAGQLDSLLVAGSLAESLTIAIVRVELSRLFYDKQRNYRLQRYTRARSLRPYGLHRRARTKNRGEDRPYRQGLLVGLVSPVSPSSKRLTRRTDATDDTGAEELLRRPRPIHRDPRDLGCPTRWTVKRLPASFGGGFLSNPPAWPAGQDWPG